jgi:hypothetical protein
MNTPADSDSVTLIDDSPTIQLASAPQQAVPCEPSADFVPGSVLCSRYELGEIIGRGATSVVFRATDLHSSLYATASPFVAIKLPCAAQRHEPEALARLQGEFTQLQRLSHPGIVRVLDMDCHGDVCFMIMEWVAGRTVKTWLDAPRSHADAMRVIALCSEALGYAHSIGVVHGDLKPTNVMVSEHGAAKLIDFGSAARQRADLSMAAASRSVTAQYASPQVLAGQSADRLDDVFSLACLSYYILSGGRHPFGGRPSLEDGRAKSAPNHVNTIPADLFAVIESGLSAERARRPESTREFLRALMDADRRPDALAVGVASYRLDIGAHRDAARTAWLLGAFVTLTVALLSASAYLRQAAYGNAVPRAAMAAASAAPLHELPVAPAAKAASRDAGVISFATQTIHASAVQSVVAIAVTRLRGTSSRGTFVWRLEGGTARPGVDYEPVRHRVVRFYEGQVVRTLFIPLLKSRSAPLARYPRTLTVALERVAGGPALGRIARASIAIDPPASGAPSKLY